MSKKLVTVGALIRAGRERHGWTQPELGRKIGMRSTASAQVQISRYENDVICPPVTVLVRIARLLKIPITRMTDAVLSGQAEAVRSEVKKT